MALGWNATYRIFVLVYRSCEVLEALLCGVLGQDVDDSHEIDLSAIGGHKAPVLRLKERLWWSLLLVE